MGAFWRRIAGNALALAATYLALGIAVELLRAHAPSGVVMRLSYALDALPARVLGRLGLLVPLREAYTDGRIPEWAVRLAFGGVAVGFVFALAFVLGAAALLLRAALESRRNAGSQHG